jgi:hypothetical protein
MGAAAARGCSPHLCTEGTSSPRPRSLPPASFPRLFSLGAPNNNSSPWGAFLSRGARRLCVLLSAPRLDQQKRGRKNHTAAGPAVRPRLPREARARTRGPPTSRLWSIACFASGRRRLRRDGVTGGQGGAERREAHHCSHCLSLSSPRRLGRHGRYTPPPPSLPASRARAPIRARADRISRVGGSSPALLDGRPLSSRRCRRHRRRRLRPAFFYPPRVFLPAPPRLLMLMSSCRW